MRRELHGLILLGALTLGGCVSTAVAIVTAPVKIVGAGIDAVYTSQAERDEKRGRQLRKQEERDARAAKKLQDADAKAAHQAEKDRRRTERAG